MNFAHLHVHTEYSLLDGSNKIKEYVARVKELGMTAAAITDHGVMYGVIDFYRAARAAGINPVLGCEVYVAPGSRFDKTAVGRDEDRYYHLVLLAENNTGYANLMKIVSRAFTEGYYYKPRVDYELLETYHEGIIALSACLAGEVQRNLARGMYEEGKKAALHYEQIFGKGNFFLELQDHGIPEQRTVNQQLMRLSQEIGIDLVATNDVHYTYAEDEKPHDILLCLQTGKKLADEDRMRYEGGQYYVKSKEEMAALFPYAPEALENTQKIADRCHVEIEFGVTKLPKFDVPEGFTSWEYLNKLCFDGLKRRYGEDPDPALVERLYYELGVIKSMGYVDYFLIVWDFIHFAKSNGIMVGPGRGSAAGSIVAYTLAITNIDPIRYQLLFERFLNPERVSMPDIDVDFCFERRQEVIDYVVRKYGKDRVVQIVTFGTLQARGVLRDVGRVMDLPYAFVDSIAKMIPKELNITLDKSLKMNHELKKLYDEDPQVKELIDMSKRLEGLPRHTSMHAAGVVISQKDVDEYVPLALGADNNVVTQFTMTTLEELGLLKMDFLGLRTLTVIQDAIRLVEKSTGVKLVTEKLNYNDKAVLDYIGTGKTDGIFQIESAGMKSFMKELRPQSLEDIIAGISLYRPGPMDFIPQYIKGKNHPELITYECPQLKPILAPTYGCIVYQEQVMQIVRDLAGYSWGGSDNVRRAMAKKKLDVMEQERQNFVYGNEANGVPGCIKNGISEQTANRIYDEMMDFAKYAFNKSHAACYAVVAYQTAYLKVHFPVQYMAWLISSVTDKTSKVAEYILAAREMGINILPVDVNNSVADFSVEGKEIRFGFNAVKSMGRPTITAIIEERTNNGDFHSMQDFITRMAGVLNKRTVEHLILAGAFDTFGKTRRGMMNVYERMIDSAVKQNKDAISGQMSLFDLVSEEDKKSLEMKVPDIQEFEKEDLLEREKEVLGVYVTGHPLDEYTGMWEKHISARSTDFLVDEETGETKAADSTKQTIGGLVRNIKVNTTKTGQQMAYLTIEDFVGTVEVILFPRSYEKNRRILDTTNKVFVTGRVQANVNAEAKLIADSLVSFESVPKRLWLRFDSLAVYEEHREELFDILKESDGRDTVTIYCVAEKQRIALPPSQCVRVSSDLLYILKNKYGEKNVATT